MINLLSPADKRQLKAARQNVLLLRYNIVILITLAVVALIYGGSFFITMQGKIQAEAQLNEDTARTSTYADVRRKAQEYAKNLTVAKTIIASEITYSTIITGIARSLPSGTSLTSLTVTPESFGKPMALNAATKNYAKALELKDALEKSPLFSDVSLESVTRVGGDEATQTTYPMSVILKAIFATEAQLKALKKEAS